MNDTVTDVHEEKPVLEVENLGRDYRMGVVVLSVLNNISIRVAVGETVAIIGASGAGKSTLLHIIGGLDQPTRGSVRFRGRDIYGMSARQRTVVRARSIGFVFQFYHLLPELDVLENVMLPAMNSNLGLLGFSGPRRTLTQGNPRERAVGLLRQVGLAERAVHLPAELSGGEQQRAAVARALVNEPELLLADEPTGNLDSKSSADILGMFQGLHQEGLTIVLVTHDPGIAKGAQRVLRLKDGNLE